eukprot:GDKI01026087.1.p1 GENE.GDKI01026087.1~~GDKI01026087.1.p1  ORF type:complete len:114 (+),score=7.92 GDKI01026087.1:30-371(+)
MAGGMPYQQPYGGGQPQYAPAVMGQPVVTTVVPTVVIMTTPDESDRMCLFWTCMLGWFVPIVWLIAGIWGLWFAPHRNSPSVRAMAMWNFVPGASLTLLVVVAIIIAIANSGS